MTASEHQDLVAKARLLAISMKHSAGSWMVPGFDGYKCAEILESLIAASSPVSQVDAGEWNEDDIFNAWLQAGQQDGQINKRVVRFAHAVLALSPKGTPGSDALDAKRYRWLREQDWFGGALCVLRDPKKVLSTGGAFLGADCPSRDRLDIAIDAAIAAQAEGGAS